MIFSAICKQNHEWIDISNWKKKSITRNIIKQLLRILCIEIIQPYYLFYFVNKEFDYISQISFLWAFSKLTSSIINQMKVMLFQTVNVLQIFVYFEKRCSAFLSENYNMNMQWINFYYNTRDNFVYKFLKSAISETSITTLFGSSSKACAVSLQQFGGIFAGFCCYNRMHWLGQSNLVEASSFSPLFWSIDWLHTPFTLCT